LKLEKQLKTAVEFYMQEIDKRNWYGLFNYGDIMHTYDRVRHTWKYDVGGFAWQNTELVPTYWLWLYFIRTGREDVFTMAEAMSRHCSEVDLYHFGNLKGIGSRHNVRHWGCSCKEPRISMAGHHRPFYYLTGDYRISEVFDDVKDADHSFENMPYFCNGDKLNVRSGPDWTSFISNWMTRYERTLEKEYRNKIETGIKDISETPLGLVSGPTFEYEKETSHLLYIGEMEKAPNMHLQTSMGGAEVLFELADMLENDTLKKIIADYGEFYYLSKEEKQLRYKGLIKERAFAFPFFAASIAAYSVYWASINKIDTVEKTTERAKLVWQNLFNAITSENIEGFKLDTYSTDFFGEELKELSWGSTNFVSQWCLNTIVTLEFIGDYLPNTLNEISQWLKNFDKAWHHRA